MDTTPVLPPPRPISALPDYIQTDSKLRSAAQKLEATFLAEMLKSAGLGAPRDTFGGGVGEDQFSSFLREAQAEEMVAAGGIGLAEALFEAMKVRIDGG
ncbi:rod-binding protein [Yoonia sp. F2084L]|uniref:rod-binding protein n=1 Tax=Yoonia sp. F2084L TaxID=2926419 RepID=UPI001FF36D9A|nr:rod-binding protein [Yoonia sp. F2084L]MCK0095789.1 rod-binding protein [Yoonia sp. F2084L]